LETRPQKKNKNEKQKFKIKSANWKKQLK